MSADELRRERRRRERGMRIWPRVIGTVAAAVALLWLGIAIGQALNDRPVPGGTQTIVRTFEPPATAP